MYLEISNIAAALGKNPYETKEKMLLTSWARHSPSVVFEYLVKNNCIKQLGINEQSFSELQKEIYENVLPDEYDVKDFKKIEEKVVKEYKEKRNNQQTEEEVNELVKLTKDSLKKDNGNLQEDKLIQTEKYKKGNDRMYYYNINENCCIGGKHDASDNELLIEIKTRVKKANVRRNDYDLYQLIGYLLATDKKKGKIVQVYNKQKYDSDVASEIEFGVINIEEESWKELSVEIINGLKIYFDELNELIKSGKFIYLNSVIPNKIRPIAKYTLNVNKIDICEENIKFKNLLRFF
jgi:hypothetical protein